jgi:hypothetical protein
MGVNDRVDAKGKKILGAKSLHKELSAKHKLKPLEGKEKSNLSGDVVLSKDEMVAEKPDKDLVGDARIPSLIKELEETRKYEYSIPAGGKSPEGKTTNSVPLGNMSPIGSRQNKIPSPVKGN